MMLLYWNANPTGHNVSFYGLAGEDFTVSGYSVSMIDAYFRYGVDSNGLIMRDLADSELYLAKYEFEASDKYTAYQDLKNKLTSLYGQGEEVVDPYDSQVYSMDGTSKLEKKEITRYFIQGDNNTWVLLEKMEVDGVCDTLILFYADGNADKRLDELVASMAREEQKNGQNNFDGL